jgi:hypothetical protein
MGLSFDDFTTDVFELFLKGEFVAGLFLEAFHHLFNGFVTLLFEAVVFALVFSDFLLGLLQLLVNGFVLCAQFLELVG